MRKDLLETYANSLPNTRPGPYIARAEIFLKWLGNKELSAQNINAWLDKMRGQDYAEGTVAQEYAIIRRLCSVNNIAWPFKRSDVPLVSEQDVFAPALDPDDIEAMVDVVLNRIPPLGDLKPKIEHRVFLALSTIYGLRRVEMQEMRSEFLDVNNEIIFVQTAKRGRQRYHAIPPVILPHLAEWGFKERMSISKLSLLFLSLKQMIGLDLKEVGWHSIRRSAVGAAYEAGLDDATIHSFYRWKRSTSDMAMRYATSRVVGRKGERATMGLQDRNVDDAVFAVHPFVKLWEDRPIIHDKEKDVERET